MKLHQLSNQREADAETVLRCTRATFDLLEDLENSALLLGRYANAVVGDLQERRGPVPADTEIDPSARRGIFHGIAYEVVDDLGDPGRVRIEPDGLRRHVEMERVLCLLEGGPNRLHCKAENLLKMQALLSQGYLA